MTVTPSSPVIGIFQDRSIAEQAIDALHSAGFTSEQVRYSAPGTSGSILADLKSLFTGQIANGGNITNDLTNMGLSNEEAQYYSNAYANGNIILAVLASGREQEALNILHQYGASNARTSDSPPPTSYTSQSSDYAQQPAYTADDASLHEQNTSDWTTQQQPSNSEGYPLQDAQQNEVSPYSDTAMQDNKPDETSTNQNPEYQSTQPLASGSHPTPASSSYETPATTSDEQVIPSNNETPVANINEQSASSSYETPATNSDEQVIPSNHEMPVATPSEQATPEPETTQPGSDASNLTAPSDAVTSDPTPGDQTTTTEPADELQQLQEQLQAAQQQLQDARTQLQTAKEHEAQVQTIREREQKLHDARQQLQDIQAQLQATMAELHETQERISQYK